MSIQIADPAGDWEERRAWLKALGLSNRTIKLYRLDRYPYMSPDAWECMVREALRSHTSLHNEQQRRKQTCKHFSNE